MKKTMRKGLLSILSCLSDSVEKKGKPSDPQTFMLAVLTSQIAYIREDVSINSSLGLTIHLVTHSFDRAFSRRRSIYHSITGRSVIV